MDLGKAVRVRDSLDCVLIGKSRAVWRDYKSNDICKVHVNKKLITGQESISRSTRS